MSYSAYRTGLRSIVRGLWSGAISLGQFSDEMRGIINRRLTQAWDEGAAECGIKPDEYTIDEQSALGNAIRSELGYVTEFGLAIQADSQANGGKLQPFFSRVETWANRYNDYKNRAKTMSCQDQKLVWILGATEQHCRTCPRLNGKVKRASFWQSSGIRPQSPPNPSIECGGWRCQCRLELTNEPISKGPLPRR